nr:hypothetical protein [Micromonospora sp. DSM 115978]
LSARGLLAASVQPARRGPLRTEIRRAVVGYVVVTALCGLLWLAVTAATDGVYRWSQVAGFAQLNAALAAAPAIREWWRHRRAPISPDPSTYRSPTFRGPAIP